MQVRGGDGLNWSTGEVKHGLGEEKRPRGQANLGVMYIRCKPPKEEHTCTKQHRDWGGRLCQGTSFHNKRDTLEEARVHGDNVAKESNTCRKKQELLHHLQCLRSCQDLAPRIQDAEHLGHECELDIMQVFQKSPDLSQKSQRCRYPQVSSAILFYTVALSLGKQVSQRSSAMVQRGDDLLYPVWKLSFLPTPFYLAFYLSMSPLVLPNGGSY